MWFAMRRAYIQRWLGKGPIETQEHLDSLYFDFLTLNDAFNSQAQKTQVTVPTYDTNYNRKQGKTTTRSTSPITAKLMKHPSLDTNEASRTHVDHLTSTVPSSAVASNQNILGRSKDNCTKSDKMRSKKKSTEAKSRKISWGVYCSGGKASDPVATMSQSNLTLANRVSTKAALKNQDTKTSIKMPENKASLAEISQILLRPNTKSDNCSNTSDAAMSNTSRGTPRECNAGIKSENQLSKQKHNDTTDYVDAIMNYQFYPPAPRDLSDIAELSLTQCWV